MMMRKSLLASVALALTLAVPAWGQSQQQERTRGQSTTDGREQQRGTSQGWEEEDALSVELSGSAMLVEAITRLERSAASGKAADWFRSCRLFSHPNPQQPWMNPNHVPGTRLASDPTAGDMGMVLSRTRLDRARTTEPAILWGFPSIVHVHYQYVPSVYTVALTVPETATLKSMVHCWLGYGAIAEAAMSLAPAAAGVVPIAARAGSAVLVMDYEGGVQVMQEAVIQAGEDPATWAAAKQAAASVPSCILPVYQASSGIGPETSTIRCGAYQIEPLTRAAKRGGAPWIGADGIYGRTVTIRTASTARIAATRGETVTTRTEATTGTQTRQTGTTSGQPAAIPE
jgi:hypothetical protein